MSKASKTQTGIRFEEDIYNKLRYISWFDRETATAVITSACERLIKDFEKKNGPITDEKLKEARII